VSGDPALLVKWRYVTPHHAERIRKAGIPVGFHNCVPE